MSRESFNLLSASAADSIAKGVIPHEAQKGSESFSLTLPIPPSTNNAYVNALRGRKLTPKGRAYKQEVFFLVRTAELRHLDLTPPFAMEVTLYFPDDRRRDVDNFQKVLQDSVFEALQLDDSHVRELRLVKAVDKENPRAEVTVKSHDVVREESA